jgi:hypothetical protein
MDVDTTSRVAHAYDMWRPDVVRRPCRQLRQRVTLMTPTDQVSRLMYPSVGQSLRVVGLVEAVASPDHEGSGASWFKMGFL